MTSPSRNAPCPCGSGRKYKKCSMPGAGPARPSPSAPPQQASGVSGPGVTSPAASPQTSTAVIRLLDKKSAVEAIDRLEMDDLKYLNRLIVERINY